MRIWTIQPIEVFEIVNRQGYYFCDINRSSFYKYEDFMNAYNWLCDKMCERIGPPSKGVKYPIWGWYMRHGCHKKPDLRERGHKSKGMDCVCLELEIDPSRIVLSDFDDWHFVLNDWFLFYPTNEEEYNKGMEYIKSLPIKKQKELKEKSWNSVFNLEKIDNDWSRRGFTIQATFWVLYKKDIVKVQRFKAR